VGNHSFSFKVWPIDFKVNVQIAFEYFKTGFIVADGVHTVMIDKIQDKIAFQVFDPVFPEFFQHFKIYIGEIKGFHFPVIDQSGVAGFSVIVVGQSFPDAVGSFFTHADVNEPGFLEGILYFGFRIEDKVQTHDTTQGFYITHFK
jgi:hypothetical protein